MEKERKIIAITGPSGVGKTTLGNNLALMDEISIPTHCTTRPKRKDDIEGFYKYLEHDQFRYLAESEKFIIYSGDNKIIKKEFGNFYGVLYEDCNAAWKISDTIILFVSYKDIERIIYLKSIGYNIDLVSLLFRNIEDGISSRLMNNLERNHSLDDINSRIRNAKIDNAKYGSLLMKNASSIVYTDTITSVETVEQVCKDLKIKKLIKERGI